MHIRVWASAVAATCCAMIAGCAAPSQPTAAPAIPVLSSADVAGGPASVAASAPVSAVASPASSDAGEVTSSELQSPVSLESVASSSTPTNLCPLLTAPTVAALLPNAEGGGPYGEDQGVEQCEWESEDGILSMFVKPRSTPWLALVARDAQQDRQLADIQHGTFSMKPMPAVAPQAESFYIHAVVAGDPTSGTSQTQLTWFVGDAELGLDFIGGPSRPDETTALVALATTLTAAAESPSFVS